MSAILTEAVNVTTGYQKLTRLADKDAVVWPESYKQCVEYLHSVNIDTSNAVQHKMISYVWDALFYKTWLYYRKTYIVDTDFFTSLTKAKSVRIYPSILQTLQFNTFAVDLGGSDIFNGYILCSFDVTEEGLYCSFLTKHAMDNEPGRFGVFLSADDMSRDEKGQLYFELDKNNEEASDIGFYRNPEVTDSLTDILKRDVVPALAGKNDFMNILGLSEQDYEHLQEMDDSYFACLDKISEDERWFILKKGLIQFAYYLCTPEPDIHETSDTKQNIRRFKKLNKKSKFDNMEYKYFAGTRIGARIRIGRVATSDIGEAVTYSAGTPKCPHVRAAHWTHVWCGPKDAQHLEPRFIEVTFVNYMAGDIDEVCNEVTDKIKQSWEGENFVCRTLDSLQLKYTRQAPVVIDNHRYKFDVALMLNGKTAYIEFDGEQHFRPVEIFGGQDGFNRTREADLIKNHYCEQNDILLLRIPYKDKSRIDAIVRNFIESPDSLRFTTERAKEYYN